MTDCSDCIDIETLIEYVILLTKHAVPTVKKTVPPKKYFKTAVDYFKDVRSGKAVSPVEITSEKDMDDCIKNSMIKYCLYEKGIQDMIQQGFIPVIDPDIQFWVEGWNCTEVPSTAKPFGDKDSLADAK